MREHFCHQPLAQIISDMNDHRLNRRGRIPVSPEGTALPAPLDLRARICCNSLLSRVVPSWLPGESSKCQCTRCAHSVLHWEQILVVLQKLCGENHFLLPASLACSSVQGISLKSSFSAHLFLLFQQGYILAVCIQ